MERAAANMPCDDSELAVSIDLGASPKLNLEETLEQVAQLENKLIVSMIAPSDFENPEHFLAVQRDLRGSNLQTSGGQKTLMISHCWRNPATQASKRKLIAALSCNGWAHWSDFLDLQATGPVPWRKEIEEGICNCAKVVMLVDKYALCEYNTHRGRALSCQT
eukprot:2179469-Rhodomonas_salina.1